MFEALSRERVQVQLCLTLAEGADTISVYLAVSKEAWPVGMVPGFCTVQVGSVRYTTGAAAATLLLFCSLVKCCVGDATFCFAAAWWDCLDSPPSAIGLFVLGGWWCFGGPTWRFWGLRLWKCWVVFVEVP